MLSDDEARARLLIHPLPPNPWVYATDQAIVIKAEYTDTIERLLRWAPKARWSARQRCWLVPLSGLELVRSILPELSRLAEAMQEAPPDPGAEPTVPEGDADALARKWFRDAARLLFGSDWQRDTARALGRDEAALACWLIGEGVVEAAPEILLGEMLALMRRRVADISAAADVLAQRIGPQS
ncbi:hypothetical protein GO613_16720 [Azoarcus communis]|uniref:HARP domain-containing protein n=1 Tax=Parazoarcus communis SWub3 = DSM 12120 TaxID=1121029 RepID=A0A323V412_9RHOO|nr:hypothetical protein [Parazoarcus communis]NMG49744.1 hypothetical protein [Parazoarcus communis]NMG72050.1 hypothetical protein [Parazoarcus communis SWub3 = DSM 12120]PZA14888.1 hypothetical protein DNK49_19450 [Azoarcus communis] [Parazoarcus communis SWub3 = DSM 12120]